MEFKRKRINCKSHNFADQNSVFNNEQPMKTILIFIVFLFIGITAQSQNTYVTISTRFVEVKSKDLLNEIDSVLIFERKCLYFNDSTMFVIDIINDNTNKEISIEARNDYELRSDEFVFIYKNHIFQIRTDSVSLDSSLYTLTRYFMNFKIEYTEYIKNLGIDDSKSIYVYEYKKNAFIRKKTYDCQ